VVKDRNMLRRVTIGRMFFLDYCEYIFYNVNPLVGVTGPENNTLDPPSFNISVICPRREHEQYPLPEI
jgi:hypothetical protein